MSYNKKLAKFYNEILILVLESCLQEKFFFLEQIILKWSASFFFRKKFLLSF